MKKAITINDIAKVLGYSRNTVAKVLNGYPMPEKTTKLVMNKAIEMGYKNLGFSKGVEGKSLTLGHIMVYSPRPIYDVDMFKPIIHEIEYQAVRHHYEVIQIVTSEPKTLTEQIVKKSLDGIICFETLTKEQVASILSLNIPTIFFDFYYDINSFKGNYTIVEMESNNSVSNYLITNGRENNIKSIGFVGNPKHCYGFQERYNAAKVSAEILHLPDINQYSIFVDDDSDLGKTYFWVEQIRNLKELPDVFMCANDFFASKIVKSLNILQIPNSEKIHVIGFDDCFNPMDGKNKFTTFSCDKNLIGSIVFDSLLSQIERQYKGKIITNILSTPINLDLKK